MSKVLEGAKPSKPENALELGLSDKVWKLLEDCWETQRVLRPSVEGVLDRIGRAASACSTLRPVQDVPYGYAEPDPDPTVLSMSLPIIK